MTNLATFEAAAAWLGVTTDLPVITGLPEAPAKKAVAIYKLTIISMAAWKDAQKTITWNHELQQFKYVIDWDLSPRYNGQPKYNHTVDQVKSSHCSVPQFLFFPNQASADYVANTHYALFEEALMLQGSGIQ